MPKHLTSPENLANAGLDRLGEKERNPHIGRRIGIYIDIGKPIGTRPRARNSNHAEHGTGKFRHRH
jgi:hypothetical protein